MKYSQEPNDNVPVAGMYYLYHEGGPKNCPIHFGGHFDSLDEMIERWNTRADLAPVVKPPDDKIADLIRFCLEYTDNRAGDGCTEAHDGLCDRWEALGMDVSGPEWIDEVLSALSLAPVTPEQAAEVLLDEIMNVEEHDVWYAAQDAMDKGGMVDASDIVIAALKAIKEGGQ